MLLAATVAAYAFAAPSVLAPARPTGVARSLPRMAGPLDAVAGPLQKWVPAAAEVSGSPLDGLPPEVIALFVAIPLVGIAGLFKANGGLGDNAPTLDLGQSRDDAQPAAAAAQEEEAAKTQAQKEAEYFSAMAAAAKEKRGGTSKRKKK